MSFALQMKDVHCSWQKSVVIIAEANNDRGSRPGAMVLTPVPDVTPGLSFARSPGSGWYSVTDPSCRCLVRGVEMDVGRPGVMFASESVSLARTPEVPLRSPRSPLAIHTVLLLFCKGAKKWWFVCFYTLCGLWILSGAGQVFKNKQNPLTNICLNVMVLLFTFRLHVGWGKMHFNPNSDKGDGFAIQPLNITTLFIFFFSEQPYL